MASQEYSTMSHFWKLPTNTKIKRKGPFADSTERAFDGTYRYARLPVNKSLLFRPGNRLNIERT